jgi:hypothetical protein
MKPKIVEKRKPIKKRESVKVKKVVRWNDKNEYHRYGYFDKEGNKIEGDLLLRIEQKEKKGKNYVETENLFKWYLEEINKLKFREDKLEIFKIFEEEAHKLKEPHYYLIGIAWLYIGDVNGYRPDEMSYLENSIF